MGNQNKGEARNDRRISGGVENNERKLRRHRRTKSDSNARTLRDRRKIVDDWKSYRNEKPSKSDEELSVILKPPSRKTSSESKKRTERTRLKDHPNRARRRPRRREPQIRRRKEPSSGGAEASSAKAISKRRAEPKKASTSNKSRTNPPKASSKQSDSGDSPPKQVSRLEKRMQQRQEILEAKRKAKRKREKENSLGNVIEEKRVPSAARRKRKYKSLNSLPDNRGFFVYIEPDFFKFELKQQDRWVDLEGGHRLKAKGGGTYLWTSKRREEKYRWATLTCKEGGDLRLGTVVKNNRLHLDGYWAYEARILNRIIQEAGQEDVTIPDRLTQEKSESGTISIHVKLPPKQKKEKKKREEPPSKPKVTPKVKSPAIEKPPSPPKQIEVEGSNTEPVIKPKENEKKKQDEEPKKESSRRVKKARKIERRDRDKSRRQPGGLPWKPKSDDPYSIFKPVPAKKRRYDSEEYNRETPSGPPEKPIKNERKPKVRPKEKSPVPGPVPRPAFKHNRVLTSIVFDGGGKKKRNRSANDLRHRRKYHSKPVDSVVVDFSSESNLDDIGKAIDISDIDAVKKSEPVLIVPGGSNIPVGQIEGSNLHPEVQRMQSFVNSLQDGALVRYGSILADKHVTFDMLANAEVEDLQELGLPKITSRFILKQTKLQFQETPC